METFWLFWRKFCCAYDSAYDSDLWFSLRHKRSYDSTYDSDSNSSASESQPLKHFRALLFFFTPQLHSDWSELLFSQHLKQAWKFKDCADHHKQTLPRLILWVCASRGLSSSLVSSQKRPHFDHMELLPTTDFNESRLLFKSLNSHAWAFVFCLVCWWNLKNINAKK